MASDNIRPQRDCPNREAHSFPTSRVEFKGTFYEDLPIKASLLFGPCGWLKHESSPAQVGKDCQNWGWWEGTLSWRPMGRECQHGETERRRLPGSYLDLRYELSDLKGAWHSSLQIGARNGALLSETQRINGKEFHSVAIERGLQLGDNC